MEIVLRIYKLNVIVVFDPLLNMIGRIFAERGPYNDCKVKMFIVFFFSQL